MPNWCSNLAKIQFPTPTKAAEFIENCTEKGEGIVQGTLLDIEPTHIPELFEVYHPTPPSVYSEEQTNKWYDWRCSNWGTKWNPELGNVIRVDSLTVHITFDTAWSPPIAWFEACGKRHKWNWELLYIETGMGFAGTATGNKTGSTSEEEFHSEGGTTDSIYKEFAYEHFGIVLDDDSDVI